MKGVATRNMGFSLCAGTTRLPFDDLRSNSDLKHPTLAVIGRQRLWHNNNWPLSRLGRDWT
jgi:hypothetical protein